MPGSTRRMVGLVLAELAGAGTLALLVYYVTAFRVAEIAGVWATDRLLAYSLLVAGLLFVFLPLSLWLRLGPLWLLATGSWGLLGYVLLFVGAPVRADAGFLTYFSFLMLLFVALGSALAVPLGLFSKKLLPSTPAIEMRRALREGMLLSLFIVTLLAMSPLGVLNWLNILLVFTIVSLTEFFFIARA